MTLKILTLNIFEGGIYFPNILKLLKREQPDIFCLQEVYNGINVTLPEYYQSMNVLQTEFPQYHSHFSPELLAITVEGKLDLGNATFSRFPILKKQTDFFDIPYGEHPQVSPVHDYSKYPQNMQTSVIDIEGKKLHVFNVHGIWGTDGDDNSERLKMSKVITHQIHGKKPAMLMGDFNVQANTKTIKNIEKHMQNVFKEDLTTSFNLAHKDLEKYPGYETAVVDMFFVSKDVKVITKSVPDDDVSDHLPLLCEVEI